MECNNRFWVVDASNESTIIMGFLADSRPAGSSSGPVVRESLLSVIHGMARQGHFAYAK